MSTDISEQVEETTNDTLPGDDALPSQEDTSAVDNSGAEEAQEDWVSPTVLQQGSYYNLSEDDIRGFSGKDEFERATSLLARQDHNLVKTSDDALPSQEEEKQPEPVDFQWGEELDALLNDPDVDPAFVGFAKQAKAMSDHYAAKLSQVDQRYEQVQAQLAQYETDRYIETFDSLVEGLPEEYAELLGKGSTRSLGNGPQFQARDSLSATYDALVAIEQQRGNPVNAQALMHRAAAATFTEFAQRQAEQKSKQKTADRLRDSNGRFTSKPTDRKTTDGLDPEEAAFARFNEVADRLGLPK